MAWNGNGDLIGGACPGNGARCGGHPDFSRDFAITQGRPDGDFPQSLPDALLERCSANVEWKVEPQFWRFDKSDHLCDPLFEFLISDAKLRVEKTVLEITDEAVRIFSKQNSAYSPGACCNKDRSQRALTDCKFYACPAPAGAERRRRHAEHSQ